MTWLFYLEFDKQNAFVCYLDIQHSNKELRKITTVSKTEALYQIGIRVRCKSLAPFLRLRR